MWLKKGHWEASVSTVMKFEFHTILRVSLGGVMMLAHGGIILMGLAAKLQIFSAWNLTFFLEVMQYLSPSQYARKKLSLRDICNILPRYVQKYYCIKTCKLIQTSTSLQTQISEHSKCHSLLYLISITEKCEWFWRFIFPLVTRLWLDPEEEGTTIFHKVCSYKLISQSALCIIPEANSAVTILYLAW
jgi:hypothetical protein